MMNLHNLPPSAILIFGALLLPLMPKQLRNLWCVVLPAAAFVWVWQVPLGHEFAISFLDFQLELVRVDRLSKAFGYIFTLNATIGLIYAFYVKRWAHHAAALIYIGSSLGVVFAGDLITLYFYWEAMAVFSTFLILFRGLEGSKKAYGAALRYVLVHVAGGLLLVMGLCICYQKNGGDLTFSAELFKDPHLGSWLVLVGFLVNAAAWPLSAWLPDAYPEATVTGGVILSAYTSKTAVYTLLRGFPGYEILIPLGCIMAMYGIIYALLENDMRRILAYSIVNQVGFMVVAAGIGSEWAINGAVAHAFCHIIYKALLWMSAGAVLYMTGKSRCTDLGGLYRYMPWTMVFGTIGALAISAVPGTSGFTSKSLTIHAAEQAHLFWPWLVLEVASAGVFLHAGIKFPYFVFFAKVKDWTLEKADIGEPPWCMRIGMALMAFLCIFLGVYPEPMYAILPYQDVFQTDPYQVFTAGHLVSQFQLLMFSGLVFFLMLPMLRRTNTIAIDTDWLYRRIVPMFYRFTDWSLNGINRWTAALVVDRLIPRLNHFFARGPYRVWVRVNMPFARLNRSMGEVEEFSARRFFYRQAMLGILPIGVTAFLAVVGLLILFFA
ncbi:Na(+)/H(+) antiporter subunit D [Sulfidibacter corallicola]|uniref:Na(+)/H(+) antiporter subunit D n=1 Tax=Sulfidibacter corallicola TaxID=2818388 RepID=A0A8A4TSN6_SULCO|nr:Na(+)/H(+) antiporter subunit D [Sulfidibacter corallicola]QTD49565.1 Na(+)/H(+) antiporter subunit D [Sulfidibacter corallicola]